MRARGMFLGALFAFSGPALVAAFFMDNLVPLVIWLAATAVVIACGREA